MAEYLEVEIPGTEVMRTVHVDGVQQSVSNERFKLYECQTCGDYVGNTAMHDDHHGKFDAFRNDWLREGRETWPRPWGTAPVFNLERFRVEVEYVRRPDAVVSNTTVVLMEWAAEEIERLRQQLPLSMHRGKR